MHHWLFPEYSLRSLLVSQTSEPILIESWASRHLSPSLVNCGLEFERSNRSSLTWSIKYSLLFHKIVSIRISYRVDIDDSLLAR